jgi:dephospho-CoA kinase
MLLFGLTGGIASGKSTVAARIASCGVPVIDADALAREVVLPGTDGLEEIRRTFGDAVLAPDGTLDRKELARLVFADDALRKRLNAITHPRIAALTASRASDLDARGAPLACYEAALIVENGMADAFRPLVVVTAPEELRVARAVARDRSTEADARARISAQISLEQARRVADFLIVNDADLEALHRRTDAVLDEIRQRLGAKA